MSIWLGEELLFSEASTENKCSGKRLMRSGDVTESVGKEQIAFHIQFII